ncbi:MAG: class I tRNA ligase family protein, partial [Gammaproteobacteria bacterium]
MSTLSLYDSLTGKVLEVRPLTPGHLQIYVCGMTVYDDCHIGHARSMLVFDVLVRILRQRDWKVTYVRNITDVDDRIIERAQLRSISASALVAEMTLSMHQDFEALGILPPDIEPKATASIAGILALIERLMANNMAYQSQSGTVWFRVKALPEYGQLSSRQHNQDHTHSRQTGSQIEEKEDPRDFALWKAADARDHSVGTVWDSPWGKGRPGWHIECSAMSMEHLGS